MASGKPHKNHKTLIEAWEALAAEGIRPTLHLTMEMRDSIEIFRHIEKARRDFGVRIVSHSGVKALYYGADALIYPSKIESLGLPLIEARMARVPVHAAELDYVRDAVDSDQTFDSRSARSMVRTVKRFLGIAAPPLPPLETADFIRQILRR